MKRSLQGEIKLIIDRLYGVECDTTDSHTIAAAIDLLERIASLPQSRVHISEKLRVLSEHMTDAAVEMDYFGGFSGWSEHGRELAGAAGVVMEWSKGMEGKDESMR